jgi:signal transduction histidine kinase
MRAIETAMDGGTYDCEYRIVRPGGSWVWITERGRVIRSAEGVNVKMVGISRDVSSEREARNERERLLASERLARDEAEQQGRLKDEFLATLSHELRTPMNAILGWLSMLMRGQVAEPARALEVIERNARAQARLIDDLLLMNKLSFGTAQLEIGRIVVSSAIEAAVQSLQPAADAKNIAIGVQVEDGLPLVRADGNRVQQILWNLLHNGIKFTPAEGTVTLQAQAAGEMVRVSVTDSGQGIAPEFLPHVFERFRQADASSTRTAWGLGLGLSIAKHLVELHGGKITVASEGVGHGATFTVELPVAGVPALQHSPADTFANLESRST